MIEPLLLVFIAIALVFDFLNGFHDSANVVASTIASKAMSPRVALSLSALTNFIGPFLFGVAVATTIGTEVVTEEAVTVPTAMAALLAAIIWNIATWWLGIPSSSSHALIGGFVGAALIGFGINAIQVEGLTKVLLALLISPVAGFILAYLILHFILWIGRGFTPRVNEYFRRGEWITTITLGLSHGTNDAQKTMGIMTFGLVAFGVLDEFVVSDLGDRRQCKRNCPGNRFGRLAVNQDHGCRFLPHPGCTRIFFPGRQHRGDIGCCPRWRSGKHNAGDQLINRWCGFCRKG